MLIIVMDDNNNEIMKPINVPAYELIRLNASTIGCFSKREQVDRLHVPKICINIYLNTLEIRSIFIIITSGSKSSRHNVVCVES